MSELRVSVLECGSPLPLFHRRLGDAKRQRTAALQNLAEFFLLTGMLQLWSGLNRQAGVARRLKNTALHFSESFRVIRVFRG